MKVKITYKMEYENEKLFNLRFGGGGEDFPRYENNIFAQLLKLKLLTEIFVCLNDITC